MAGLLLRALLPRGVPCDHDRADRGELPAMAVPGCPFTSHGKTVLPGLPRDSREGLRGSGGFGPLWGLRVALP